MHRSLSTRRLATVAALVTLAPLAAACGGDDDDSAATVPATDPAGSPTTPPATGFDPARCAANEAVGTITYASSYDFAASASILEVVVADARGYFAEMCLDVELVPGFSSTNYPLVDAGEA